MSVISSIKNFIPSVSTIAGIAALGYVAHDAHYVGKIQSDLYASERDASNVGYYLNNEMHNSSMSLIQDKIKQKSYDMELDHTYKRFFNEGIGYIKGFTSMLVDHVVPLALGLGATFLKGVPKKISAIGIGIYGGYIFLKNFFGIGTPPGLDKLT
jgi:hypothetical protein